MMVVVVVIVVVVIVVVLAIVVAVVVPTTAYFSVWKLVDDINFSGSRSKGVYSSYRFPYDYYSSGSSKVFIPPHGAKVPPRFLISDPATRSTPT